MRWPRRRDRDRDRDRANARQRRYSLAACNKIVELSGTDMCHRLEESPSVAYATWPKLRAAHGRRISQTPAPGLNISNTNAPLLSVKLKDMR